MKWDLQDWVNYYVVEDRWSWLSNMLAGHPKVYEAGKLTDFLVCSACKGFFVTQEGHSCPGGQLLSFHDAKYDETVRRAFVHEWVGSVIYEPKGRFKEFQHCSAQVISHGFIESFCQKLLHNADSLLNEAIQLFEGGHHARAAFLALLAQEELVRMYWAHIEGVNSDGRFYQFPIKGCAPGFTFQRFYLALRGLRLKSWCYEKPFVEGLDMMDHDAKLAVVKIHTPFLTTSLQTPLVTLDHFSKYELLYGDVQRLPELLRYIDLDCRSGVLSTPDSGISQREAFDHIALTCGILHDWAEHGFWSWSFEYKRFIDHAQKRYQQFLDQYNGIQSEVFPKPRLTPGDKAILAFMESLEDLGDLIERRVVYPAQTPKGRLLTPVTIEIRHGKKYFFASIAKLEIVEEGETSEAAVKNCLDTLFQVLKSYENTPSEQLSKGASAHWKRLQVVAASSHGRHSTK